MVTVVASPPLVDLNDAAPARAGRRAYFAPFGAESAFAMFATFAPDRSTAIWLLASPFAPTWNFRVELLVSRRCR